MSSEKRNAASILLVDGPPTVQHLRALMLRLEGHKVDTASDLASARDVLALRRYDLVIIDVGHFAQPGLDFCEDIKKRWPHQKVLMQADDRVYVQRDSCPDRVVSKQDNPRDFVQEVQLLLSAS